MDETMMIRTADGSEIEVRSERVVRMIEQVLRARPVIELANKGRLELNFAGSSVRKSVTLHD